MGKREIVLIAVFLLMGLAVYQLTAPRDETDRGFSVSGIIEDLKSEIHRPRHSAEATVSSNALVPPEVRTISVPDFRGKLTIIGEARDDVGAELRTAVWTEDRDESNRWVKAVSTGFSTRDGTLEVRIEAPDDVPRIRSELTLRVPERLGVRAQVLSGATEVRGVAAAALEARGGVVVADVRGEVSGEFRDGEVRIDGAGSVRVDLRRCEATLADIAAGVDIEASDGELHVRGTAGEVRVTAVRVDTTLEETSGPLHVSASDGRATIAAPAAAIDIEAVRTPLTLRLTRAVAVHAATTDERIEFVPPEAGITLTAVASEGRIRSDLAGLVVEKQEALQRAQAELAGGGPTVSLRTTRGDIEILPPGTPADVER